MTWNNDMEQNPYREYEGYTGSSQHNELPHVQQQQTYSQPMQGSNSAYNQPPFMVTPPYGDGRLAAALCYSCGWLTGLLFLLFGDRRPLMRFHAVQSLVFFGIVNLIDIGLLRIMFVFHHSYYLESRLLPWVVLVFLFLNFIAFVGWIVAMVQSGRGLYYRMPFVGNLIAKSMHLKDTPHW